MKKEKTVTSRSHDISNNVLIKLCSPFTKCPESKAVDEFLVTKKLHINLARWTVHLAKLMCH